MKYRIKKHSFRWLPVVLLIAGLMSVIFDSSAKARWRDGVDARKADYLYLEALNQKEMGNTDASLELLMAANVLNPSEETISYELAYHYLNLSPNDTTLVSKALKMIKRYNTLHPDDFTAALLYAAAHEFFKSPEEALQVWGDIYRLFPDRDYVVMKYAAMLSGSHNAEMIKQANRIYDSIASAQGTTSEIALSKIQNLYALGDTTALLKELYHTMGIGKRKQDVEDYVIAGTVFGALEMADSAEYYFKEACRIDSTSGLAYFSLVDYYNSKGDSIKFDHAIGEAVRCPSLDADTKVNLVTGFIKTHFSDSTMRPQILDLLNVMVEQHPHEAPVHRIYGDYLMTIDKVEGAAEQLSYALDIDPTDINLWMQLAYTYNQLKDFDKSMATIDDAIRYFPESDDLYWMKSSYYHLNNNLPKAHEAILKAIEVAEKNSDKNNNLSNLYCSLGDINVALKDTVAGIEAYEKAIVIDPDNSGILNNYAYCLACIPQDLDRAQRMVERALLIQPENLNAIDTYAWVMFQKKDYQAARKIFDDAMEKMLADPNISAEFYHHAGDIYFMTGDPEKAIEFWEQGLKMEPDNELLQRKVKNKTYFYK